MSERSPSDPTRRVWPAMLTWRAQDVSRMESVRVQLSGKRIKANGRIVAAATATNPAFGAFYELQTDESRCHQAVRADRHAGRAGTPARHRPRRGEHVVGAPTTRGSGARPTTAPSTSTWCSARSSTRCRSGASACTSGRTRSTLPMVYVNVPEMTVTAATVSYTSAGGLDGDQAAFAGGRHHRDRRRRRVHRRLSRLGRADLITPPARPAAASSSRQFSAPITMVKMSERGKLS